MYALYQRSQTFPEDRAIDAAALLIFLLNEVRYALPLESVERVVRAAAVTPLPKAPGVVLGVLDLHGAVIPVFDVRKRFGIAQRELRPSDHFVIARCGGRVVALAVDEARDVVAGEAPVVPAHDIHDGAGYLAGVTRTAEGLVLIHDLQSFLSEDEETTLSAALQQRGG